MIGKRSEYRFFVEYGLMYFLHKGNLNCVSIHKENGLYHFQFDNRRIQIDCTTGNCIILDFQSNCFEYFCVGSFLKTTIDTRIINKQLFFLYQLLIREKINHIGKKNIRSLRLFIKPDELLGQIEIFGKSCLKHYSGCISFRGMFQGIEGFISNLVSSDFIRSNCLSRKMIYSLTKKRVVDFSESGIYGIERLLRGKNKHLRSIAMISNIMRRFLGEKKGVSTKWIANGLFGKAIAVCCTVVSRNILKNLNSDLNEASDQMNKVVNTCSSRATNLSSKCSPALNSISKCVSEMLNMSEKRDLEKSAKRCCLEQKKQEVRMRELSSLAFQEGIKEIDKSMRCVQQLMPVLEKDEIVSGERAIMPDIGEKRKHWDDFDKVFEEDSEEEESEEETSSLGKRTNRFE
jgi:hypothetical protein